LDSAFAFPEPVDAPISHPFFLWEEGFLLQKYRDIYNFLYKNNGIDLRINILAHENFKF